jgi:hypothetical protein
MEVYKVIRLGMRKEQLGKGLLRGSVDLKIVSDR